MTGPGKKPSAGASRPAAVAGAPAEVHVVEPTGSELQVVTRMGGADVLAVFRERHKFEPGQTIRLKPDPRLVHLFDEAGQRLDPETG